MTETKRRRWLAVALFVATAVVALLLYTQTVHPGVYWGDTAEFQRVASTLELPHPTGYPLYILLGHLWVAAWPFGSVAAKMNILSGVLAALAVGLVSVLVYRVTRRAVAAAFAGLMLAVTSSFWSQAVVAEIYSLHTLLVAGTLLTLLWDRPLRASLLPVTAFLVGLGFAHHRMVILLLPGIIAFFLCERLYKGLSVRRGAAIVLGFLLGLSPYLLTYIQGDWPTVRLFLGYVLHSGEQWFSVEKLAAHFGAVVWPLLQQQISLAGLLLGIVGLFYSYWRMVPRSFGTLLLLGMSWLLALGFLTVYRVGDIYAFFPHFQVLNAILMGFGLAELLLWLGGIPLVADRSWLVEGVVWGLMALALVLIGRDSWQANDLSQERYVEDRALRTLNHVQSDSLLVTGWPAGQPLRYHQEIGGLRRDLEIVIDDAPAAHKVQGYVDTGRPAFFWGSEWIELVDGDEYQLVHAEDPGRGGDLFRVLPLDSAPLGAAYARDVDQAIVADLVLASYRLRPLPLEADGIAELTLCWSGDAGLLRDRTVLFQVDPDHDWVSHEFEIDSRLDASGCSVHHFILPPAPFVENASAAILVLPKNPSEPGAEILLDSIAIAPGRQVSPQRLVLTGAPSPEVMIEGARLIGVSNEPVTSAGISFPVDAYWMVPADTEPGQAVQLELRNAAGEAVDSQVWSLPAPSMPAGEPMGGLYATRYWPNVPRRAEAGVYTIHIGAVESPELARASSIEIEEPERLRSRPGIAHSLVYEFADGHILLAGYDLADSAEAIDLTLYWKSVEPVDGNWKVFVHLVDQAGVIVAQNDSFPGQGLRWTDTWQPGEYVVDQHRILLPEALSSGDYAVLVGMYDPELGVRVPIRLEPGGIEIADPVRLTSIAR